MPRRLQPEILDSLSPQHPDAMHSRRDLLLINRIMGNYRWFLRALPPLLRPGEALVELGAGYGELAELFARRGVAVDAIDQAPPPDAWPAGRRWHRGDLRNFSDYADYRGVIGNMVFHHFPDEQLAPLGRQLSAHARVILACEPARRRGSQLLFRFVATLLGANHVTLHDAHVSITAGFHGDELPRALGLDPAVWQIDCHQTFLGAYRMIAVRHE